MRNFSVGLVVGAGALALVVACGDSGTTSSSSGGTDDSGASSSSSSSSGGDASHDSSTDGGKDSSAPGFLVSGTVKGLAGAGLELQVSAGGESLVIPKPAAAADAGASDGGATGPTVPFSFTKKLAQGTAYAVTVKTQPSGATQTCSVMNGTGTIGSADVTGVQVVCATNAYTVKGTITGLAAGASVTIQNNGGDDIALTSATVGYPNFTFATKVASGAAYAVTVKTQPTAPPQICKVTKGSGPVTNADITDVAIDCKNAYQVGGMVTGLGPGKTLVLQDNAGDDLTLTEATAGMPSFNFATRVGTGDNYAVTVKTQPANRNCVVTNGSSAIGAADVTNVQVTCTCGTNKVLLLGSSNGEKEVVETALVAAGLAVTKVTTATSYANVPDASTFNAVVVLVGDEYGTDMNATGQTGLVTAHNAGVGLVYSEWGGYHVEQGRWQTIKTTLIGQRAGGGQTPLSYTVAAGQEAHPVWFGLPANFTTASALGYSPLDIINGGTLLAGCATCGNAGVIIKDAAGGAGRTVQNAAAPGYSGGTLNGDVNALRMYTNSARWASTCD